MTDRIQLRRALLSVYDKEGLEELATALHAAGVELVSTGSTATRIAAAGIPVIPVEQLTGFPECLDGRVKTLHPRIHAGILADRRLLAHVSQIEELGVAPLRPGGGEPLPVRGHRRIRCRNRRMRRTDRHRRALDGARRREEPPERRGGHLHIAVPRRPGRLAEGEFTLQQRRDLATEAFRHTASYDIAVASWMGATVATRPGTGSRHGWERPG